ncbi:trypsin-like serine peptidase [Pseudomonas sp. S32]|uniref:trypsin-like serine peptidase n=1 Tax=Pseudomonas sp. S32 TaxID=2767448 RepID=UPI00191335AD|nr:serine protease [Pseudomonas sp. S32]MBK5008000.1 trypsin-like peptidase domain-containing protein [Pseudomonas sp. S32]
MASIAEELTFTTVRLEGQLANGSTVGTGCLFLKYDRIFVVTNKHVVRGVINGQFHVSRANAAGDGPELGSPLAIQFTEHDFVGHPDPDVDVAVMNVSQPLSDLYRNGTPPFFKNLAESHFPTAEHFDKFIGPMEEIVFIGYPSGMWDSVNGSPISRRGMTATPCYVDFEGTKTFLIDASVFPGSSGSPVFIYYAGGHPDKEGNLYAGNRVHFLGLISSVYHRDQEGDIKVVAVPTAQRAYAEFRQMIDIGVVFKWGTVSETIDLHMARHGLSHLLSH